MTKVKFGRDERIEEIEGTSEEIIDIMDKDQKRTRKKKGDHYDALEI